MGAANPAQSRPSAREFGNCAGADARSSAERNRGARSRAENSPRSRSAAPAGSTNQSASINWTLASATFQPQQAEEQVNKIEIQHQGPEDRCLTSDLSFFLARSVHPLDFLGIVSC